MRRRHERLSRGPPICSAIGTTTLTTTGESFGPYPAERGPPWMSGPVTRVVVIGCAGPSKPRDFVVETAGILQHQVLSRTRGFWQHSAPVQVRFPHTYSEARAITTATLPGTKWRQLPPFRYLVV